MKAIHLNQLLQKERIVQVFGEVYELDKWYHLLKDDYDLQKSKEDIIYYAYLKYGEECMRKIRGSYSWLYANEEEVAVYAPCFNLYPLYYTCSVLFRLPFLFS